MLRLEPKTAAGAAAFVAFVAFVAFIMGAGSPFGARAGLADSERFLYVWAGDQQRKACPNARHETIHHAQS